MPRQPRQEDVAALAGVSRSTVSIVLNNRTDRLIRISEETRRKVWQAAEQLGYEPNELARSLRSGQSHNIGVLVPNLFNMHYMEMLDSIERELTEQAYYVTLVVSNFDPERERSCFRSLFQQRLDGLILMPTYWEQMPEEMSMLASLARPAVFLTPGIVDHDSITSDMRSGADAMMDHLLALGHRRIAFVNGVARGQLTEHRQSAYRSKLASANIALDDRLFVNCGHTMDSAYEAVSHLLDLADPPTAIWTINDFLAVGARRAIYDRGLRIPNDVALAGFDGTALAAQMAPPLTSVYIQGREIGKLSAQMLLNRVEEPGADPVAVVMDTRLLTRASTDPSAK